MPPSRSHNSAGGLPLSGRARANPDRGPTGALAGVRSRELSAARHAGEPTAPIEVVLKALMDEDPLRALDAVEAAGGPAAFDDDAAFVASVYAQRELDLRLEDARALARLIAADVEETRATPEGGARELLARLTRALGVATRARGPHEPVRLTPSAEPRWRDPRDRHAVAPTRPLSTEAAPAGVEAAPARSTRTSAHGPRVESRGPLGTGPVAPPVRGILRDVHTHESWLPRVDRLAVLIAPAAMPGVYALQRRAVPGEGPAMALSPDALMRALDSGRALSEDLKITLRDRMGLELALAGIDLDQVEIHDDAEADALCRALACEAFAVGTHLFFREGAFQPETDEGLHLLLHELTHVAQQARGEVGPGLDAQASLEQEAEALADRLMSAEGEPREAAPDKAAPDKAAPGKAWVDLRLAEQTIRVAVPEAGGEGAVEVVFDEDPSPFSALVLERARLELGPDGRVVSGEVRGVVSLEPYLRAGISLAVFDDGRVETAIRGLQVDLGEHLRAEIELSVGATGLSGAGTVSVASMRLSEAVTLGAGILHVRVEAGESFGAAPTVSAHGLVTAEIVGLGSVELEASYLDGAWCGQVKTLEEAAAVAKRVASRAKTSALRELRLDAITRDLEAELDEPTAPDADDAQGDTHGRDEDDEREREDEEGVFEEAEELYDELDHLDAEDHDWDRGWL